MTHSSRDATGVTASPRARPQPRRSRLELAVVPAAVRIARHWTADQLARTGTGTSDDDLIDSAVLVVSELVTNAITAVTRDITASRQAAASRPATPALALTLPGRVLTFADLRYRASQTGYAITPGQLPGPRPAPRPASLLPLPPALPPPSARVSLVLARFGAIVRIEVHDSSRAPLRPVCERDEEDETGRGLLVVAALAETWGWQPEPFGKVVWCELAG